MAVSSIYSSIYMFLSVGCNLYIPYVTPTALKHELFLGESYFVLGLVYYERGGTAIYDRVRKPADYGMLYDLT